MTSLLIAEPSELLLCARACVRACVWHSILFVRMRSRIKAMFAARSRLAAAAFGSACAARALEAGLCFQEKSGVVGGRRRRPPVEDKIRFKLLQAGCVLQNK
jgi:hypothetical protein